jgi:precorrin-6Y C5,15-methyltransferase (decarboxylating)
VSTEPIAIVGLLGGQWFGRAAEEALRRADVLLGNARQFEALTADIDGERVELWGDLGAVVDRAVELRAAGRLPCILADGDPGYHGMVRFAAGRLGEGGLAVHPAPSSIALAWARVGANWDDAEVASAYAQSVEEVVATVTRHHKVAVLVSRHLPPAALGAALVAAGCDERAVTVCTHLAEPDETIVHTDLAGLAGGAGLRPGGASGADAAGADIGVAETGPADTGAADTGAAETGAARTGTAFDHRSVVVIRRL